MVAIRRLQSSAWMLLLPMGTLAAAVAGQPPVIENLSNLPLAFEENRGQAPQSVDFLARGQGYTVALSHGDARISMRRKEAAAAVDLHLLGARAPSLPVSRKPLPGKVNYYFGNDPARWRADIPTFERVEYRRVYPGIDLAYYGNQRRLEYDFIVAPGADPSSIRLAVDGARKLSLTGTGSLLIDTENGAVEFRKPATYQEIGGRRRAVESQYILEGANQVRFALGKYDPRQSLVIDPTLIYSTYLGGSTLDYGIAIAIGPGGNAFVTGYTQSLDFPTVNPEQSFYAGSSAIFVSKLAVSGSSLLYSTYFGGSNNDHATSIAVDSSNNAYIVGSTSSTDFPVKNPLYPTLAGSLDGFVTKLSAAGNALVYSTYLGGADDSAAGVAVDAGHNVYIAGYTSSPSYPVTPGAYLTSCNACTGFVTKLNPTGSAQVWSTFFGQSSSAYLSAIAVDSQGSAYLTGYSYGGLPASPGAPQPQPAAGSADAFIAKLNNTGTALSYATYLGGSQWDQGNSIAVDSAGNAYVAGSTTSPDLPVTASALQPAAGGVWDGFVAELNSLGTAWQYVTYLGGQGDDRIYGIAVDSSGNATVAGHTSSYNFPHHAALQTALAGYTSPLFKTASMGSAWQPANAGLPTFVIQLAVDPVSDAHLIAATGEGLYQSSDGGGHWLPTSIADNVSAQSYFQAVVFGPSGSGTVYTAIGAGVYSSSDSGATWAYAGNAPCWIYSMTVDPTTPAKVYVANQYANGPSAESQDGGVTWTAIGGSLTGAVIYDFAINPNAPGVVYAATNGGIFRTTNAGQAWTQLTTLAAYWVTINPKRPSTLYAIMNGAVYSSTNSGTAWTPTGTFSPCIDALAIAPSNPAVLYAGTCIGVFATTTSGASWSPAGLSTTSVMSLAVDPQKPGTAYAMPPPLTSADAFVAKISPSGQLIYSTYLGGAGWDNAYGVAVNSAGDAFVTGETLSPDFPTTAGAIQAATGQLRNTNTTAYVARISAKTAACTYSPAPASYFFYPGGGTANFSITSATGCSWTPTSADSWITIQSYGGPGLGPLVISVSTNPGAARTGSIAVGTGSISITQAAAGCTYSLSTYAVNFPQSGGPASIGVTAPEGCQWMVSNLPNWVIPTSGATGTGSGTVLLEAAPNPFPGVRYPYGYNVAVAQYEVGLNQSGTSADAATDSLKPKSSRR
jgi:photosystem II stability/assembly factor-like uncharacterized protein